MELGSALQLGLTLTLGIVLGTYESEGDPDKSDGDVLVVSLRLGEAEIEGAKLELGLCDIDGSLLILAIDGMELGSVLQLGLPLILGIVLGAYESEGPTEEDGGNTLGVSLILGKAETEGTALELGSDEADGPLLLLVTDGTLLGSALQLGLPLILGIVLGANESEGVPDKSDGNTLFSLLGVLVSFFSLLGFSENEGIFECV